MSAQNPKTGESEVEMQLHTILALLSSARCTYDENVSTESPIYRKQFAEDSAWCCDVVLCGEGEEGQDARPALPTLACFQDPLVPRCG